MRPSPCCQQQQQEQQQEQHPYLSQLCLAQRQRRQWQLQQPRRQRLMAQPAWLSRLAATQKRSCCRRRWQCQQQAWQRQAQELPQASLLLALQRRLQPGHLLPQASQLSRVHVQVQQQVQLQWLAAGCCAVNQAPSQQLHRWQCGCGRQQKRQQLEQLLPSAAAQRGPLPLLAAQPD